MNNNNLYNTNNFIGITHNDYFKVASNALAKSINSLDLNSSNYASNISNVLDLRSSNFTSNYANIIEYNSSNYTKITSNIIQTNINKLIKQVPEDILLPIPTTLNHTYIYNSNVLGEIRFWCKSTSDFIVVIPAGVPDYRVKIDVDGKLKVYYTYDPLINLTFGNGWVDVGNSIAALNASDANIGISITTLEAQVLANKASFDEKIQNLLQGLLQYNCISQSDYTRIRSYIQDMTNTTSQGARGSLEIIYNSIRSAFLSGRAEFLQNAANNITLAISQNSAAAFYLGIGGVAVGAATSVIQNLGYLNTISAQINNNIESNTNLTRSLKDELINSNLIEDTKYFMNYCQNTSNMTITQGFLNTYNTDIQYIPNLSTSNLYINTGNLNKLVASSSISENGILLSNKYLTSNHLYNMTSSYSSERQYPSKLFSVSQPEGTGTILNKLVYKQIIYLDNNNITYGSGFYEIYSSSTYDTNTSKNKLFNFDTSETNNTPRWGIALYNSGTGNYQGDNSIDGIYYGDWVILKMPQPILLTRFRIYQNTQFPLRSPSEWKVYGSNDGINFTQITEGHQLTRLISTDYTSGYYNKALAATFTVQYQYFGFAFGKLLSVSGETTLNFAELQIFGKEILNNTINSNIYCTSNAVRNIVQYDMPPICKHLGIYCEITTPININSITYYKYDLDLRNYTSLGYLQVGASYDPYRIYKISLFYASLYFEMLTNNEPNICSYDVYMAYKNNGLGLGQQYQGLNVAAIGLPPNFQLKNILNTDLFILRHGANSIDFITLVAKSPSLVRVLIEDRIG